MSAGWIRVASLGDIEEGGTLQVGVAGEPVCLYKIGGQVFATQDICTHAQASLSEGFVDGDCIECPLHQALFHIPTGEVRSAPATENLRVYPVLVEGLDVHVQAN